MSTAIISFMFIILSAVAIAHFAWAFGFSWPIRNEKLLAQAVVGTAGVERMPPRLASLAVAIFLAASLVISVAMGSPEEGDKTLTIAGWGLALLYLARGIAGYTSWWASQTPEPIFRLNDRRVYSPICIFLGLGFAALAIIRMSA